MFTLSFQIYPEFQILGVSLAAALPAARVATFTSIFFASKKGYPLPSLTRKTVLQHLSEDNKLFHTVSF